ncbi:bacillithiol biosynthesis BshC, partial [Bacillus sp. MHSD17]|nr:bacillithiol biosynthesis BshC [Bacillus sp. MHSD17]
MEIKEISVPQQGVVADYMNDKKEIQSCFDYMLTEDAFKQRVQDLREREFFRQDLVTHLSRRPSGLRKTNVRSNSL